MEAIQQPHVDGKRLGRPRGRAARSTPEPKIAPVPDFSKPSVTDFSRWFTPPAERRGHPRNTTGQSIVRCPAQREITSAARGSG